MWITLWITYFWAKKRGEKKGIKTHPWVQLSYDGKGVSKPPTTTQNNNCGERTTRDWKLTFGL